MRPFFVFNFYALRLIKYLSSSIFKKTKTKKNIMIEEKKRIFWPLTWFFYLFLGEAGGGGQTGHQLHGRTGQLKPLPPPEPEAEQTSPAPPAPCTSCSPCAHCTPAPGAGGPPAPQWEPLHQQAAGAAQRLGAPPLLPGLQLTAGHIWGGGRPGVLGGPASPLCHQAGCPQGQEGEEGAGVQPPVLPLRSPAPLPHRPRLLPQDPRPQEHAGGTSQVTR